jgi:hypothetical protein
MLSFPCTRADLEALLTSFLVEGKPPHGWSRTKREKHLADIIHFYSPRIHHFISVYPESGKEEVERVLLSPEESRDKLRYYSLLREVFHQDGKTLEEGIGDIAGEYLEEWADFAEVPYTDGGKVKLE